jgi:hypothetical protein
VTSFLVTKYLPWLTVKQIVLALAVIWKLNYLFSTSMAHTLSLKNQMQLEWNNLNGYVKLKDDTESI